MVERRCHWVIDDGRVKSEVFSAQCRWRSVIEGCCRGWCHCEIGGEGMKCERGTDRDWWSR